MRFSSLLSQSLLIPLFTLPTSSASLPAIPSNILKVQTTSGLVHGLRFDPLVDSFLGIPYAHSPTGLLRFKPPKPLKNPSKVVNATQFGFACYRFLYYAYQLAPLEPRSAQGEDCLNLNIWRPSRISMGGHGDVKGDKKKKLLPVMVWIHGGGFTAGSNSDSVYDGAKLVKNTQNVILVSINYRLGLLGFPLTPGIPLAQTNPGLLDQRLALEWVRDNIRSFGGDPSRITLFGESAGGTSIDYMSYAYPKDPIASAFIIQSGQVELFPGDTVDADGASWKIITDAVGCTNLKDRKDELKCMQRVDAKKLQDAALDLKGSWITGPHVDGVLVLGTEEYKKRQRRGSFAKIPTLVGNTNNEGDILIIETSPGNNTLSDELTLINFTCPAAIAAKSRDQSNVPVWRYRWMGAFPSARIFPTLRAYHAIELFWIFGSFRELAALGLPAPLPYELEAEKWIQNTWTNFAENPKATMKKLGWKEYDPKEKTLAEIFVNDTAEVKFVKGNKYDDKCPSVKG